MNDCFEKELKWIANPKIKEIAEEGIALLPDYFYEVAASSTGKYHPAYTLGEGGLCRHTKAAVGIAKSLFRINTFSSDEQDIILTSLILHDGWKRGDNHTGFTTHTHPLQAVTALREGINVEGNLDKENFLNMICDNISSHMGQWTTSKYDSVVLPLPVSKMQRFVHMCDYLASRKMLLYDFESGGEE